MKFSRFLLFIFVLTSPFAWAQPESKPTEIIQFEVAEATPVKEGNCWTESISTPRKGAWRCMIGNDIYDPCFSTSSKHMVICGMNPAEDKKGFAVKLTKPLPKSSIAKLGKGRPFQVRLKDESVCAPFTGTLTPVGKEIIEYGCQNKYCPTPESCQIGILSINRKKPQWMAKVVVYTVSKAGKLDVKAFQEVPVETVWE